MPLFRHAGEAAQDLVSRRLFAAQHAVGERGQPQRGRDGIDIDIDGLVHRVAVDVHQRHVDGVKPLRQRLQSACGQRHAPGAVSANHAGVGLSAQRDGDSAACIGGVHYAAQHLVLQHFAAVKYVIVGERIKRDFRRVRRFTAAIIAPAVVTATVVTAAIVIIAVTAPAAIAGRDRNARDCPNRRNAAQDLQRGQPFRAGQRAERGLCHCRDNCLGDRRASFRGEREQRVVNPLVVFENQFTMLAFGIQLKEVLVAYRCPVPHMDNQVIPLPFIKINRFGRSIYSHNACLG
ncbi:hypothetical protein BN135_1497 [Cronobacter muytjensii 530]